MLQALAEQVPEKHPPLQSRKVKHAVHVECLILSTSAISLECSNSDISTELIEWHWTFVLHSFCEALVIACEERRATEGAGASKAKIIISNSVFTTLPRESTLYSMTSLLCTKSRQVPLSDKTSYFMVRAVVAVR